jgi:hypothetical protein
LKKSITDEKGQIVVKERTFLSLGGHDDKEARWQKISLLELRDEIKKRIKFLKRCQKK